MRGLVVSRLCRVLSALALTAGLWCAAGEPAKADGVEYLMVPSAAMGRDIPVAFMAGGPHAVYLLDAFNAAPEVSNWVTAGNAMTTLAGKGISVAAPAGGAWSMYTNWEQDGSRQWDTFLSQELPDWLAANKGLAPGGHGVVGAGQIRRTGAGHLPPGPVSLRRVDVGCAGPGADRCRRRGHRWHGAVWWCRHSQHVGTATARPLEMALTLCTRGLAGEQQHPHLGLQSRRRNDARPGGHGRLLRNLQRHQPHLLQSVSKHRRQQRALRLPGFRRARLV